MSNEQNTKPPMDHATIYAESRRERHRVLVEDQKLPARELDAKYNPHGDGGHPYFCRARWRDAVADEQTIIGYWDWVEYQIEQYHAEHSKAGPALIQLINETIVETFADTTPATDHEVRVIFAVLKKLGVNV